MTDAPRAPRERPLSPHLSVWRPHVTMTTSILHRIAGAGLYFGALILAGWAIALASGPEAYATFKSVLGSPLGKLVMLALTLGTFYHTGKGVQHLAWDLGYGFQPKTASANSIVVIAFTLAATVAVWAIAAMTGAL
jgi:succinate dehydrogenase / fumarate reductase, cytochrome b subunit